MKNLISTFAVIALLFSINTNAQEQKPVQNKKKAKTEKSCCSTEEKKSCGTEEKKSCGSEEKSEKKAACCSTKKS